MLIKIIIITVVLLVIAGIGLALKYYNQKRSPFYKKWRIGFFKRNELKEYKKTDKD
jgi:hypothetical protein